MSISSIMDFVRFFIEHDYTNIIFYWKFVAVFVIAVFVVGVGYAVQRTQIVFRQLRANAKLVSKTPRKGTLSHAAPEAERNLKNIVAWQKIMSRAISGEESERKIAIITADSLIDVILKRAGYTGENLGDRLKKIESSDLDSLHDLWEAHKVRNRIAHEPFMKLSSEDALRALGRYEKTLRELNYL